MSPPLPPTVRPTRSVRQGLPGPTPHTDVPSTAPGRSPTDRLSAVRWPPHVYSFRPHPELPHSRVSHPPAHRAPVYRIPPRHLPGRRGGGGGTRDPMGPVEAYAGTGRIRGIPAASRRSDVPLARTDTRDLPLWVHRRPPFLSRSTRSEGGSGTHVARVESTDPARATRRRGGAPLGELRKHEAGPGPYDADRSNASPDSAHTTAFGRMRDR